MKVSEFKNHLQNHSEIRIQLPSGELLPNHYHITEMGIINKKYTDCGNTFREENYFTFQLWHSTDTWHQLKAEKVLKIISGIEKQLQSMDDLEIIIEYQNEDTIGKFGLEYNQNQFQLTATKTTCLAQDNCGIPSEKIRNPLKQLTSSCAPNTNCC
jgi:Family of unknown function (DUF6428)